MTDDGAERQQVRGGAGGGRIKRGRGQAAPGDVHQVRPHTIAGVDRGVRLGKDQREEGADEVHARGAGPGRRVEPSEAADQRPQKKRVATTEPVRSHAATSWLRFVGLNQPTITTCSIIVAVTSMFRAIQTT